MKEKDKKLTVWCVEEIGTADDPCVVDEDVHSADLGFYSLRNLVHVLPVSQVAPVHVALAASLLHFPVEYLYLINPNPSIG